VTLLITAAAWLDGTPSNLYRQIAYKS